MKKIYIFIDLLIIMVAGSIVRLNVELGLFTASRSVVTIASFVGIGSVEVLLNSSSTSATVFCAIRACPTALQGDRRQKRGGQGETIIRKRRMVVRTRSYVNYSSYFTAVL